MTGKGILQEKDLLEKATTLKIIEYSPLDKEFKKQTSVAEKQCQDFDKVFNYNEKEEPLKIEKEEPLTIDESNLFYNNKHTFNEFKNVEKYAKKSITARYDNILLLFYQRLKEFKQFTPWTVKTKTKKDIVYKNSRKLYSKLLRIYCNDYNNTTNKGKEKVGEKHSPNNLLIEGFKFIYPKKKDE